MNTKIRSLGGAAAVAALAAGAFALGLHAGPARGGGHDLLRMAAATGAPSSSPGLSLTSFSKRVAQEDRTDGRSPGSSTDADDTSDAPGSIFRDVYALLREKYVDALPTDAQFGHGAAASMLASLQDPETRFLEPADMTELASEARGAYHGLGAVTDVREITHPKMGDNPAYTELRLTIVSPMPGSPAEKAGLQPGDYVTQINGQEIGALMDSTWQFDPAVTKLTELKRLEADPVAYNKVVAALEAEVKAALPMADAQGKLEASDKPLTLTVMRPGDPKPMTVAVDPAVETQVTPITSRILPGEIGYIRINQFTDGADAQFKTALTALNPTTLKGLVVDLRDCPGGLLDVGQAIAGDLTGESTFGYLETKGHRQTPLTISGTKMVACPVIALVNGGTANTAELLAATLETSGDKVIGTQTYGDAADVRPVALRDGSGFTMTVGRLLTADRQPFAGTGIKPTTMVPDSPGTDAPLERAVDMLSSQVALR